MISKNILILVALLYQSIGTSAQCVSGNCDNGVGKYIYPDKSVYEGAFKGQKANGRGTCKFESGNIYTGMFLNGQMQGQGEIVFNNGNKYIGSFKANKINGIGEFQLTSGGKYIGKFEDGLLNGRAQYFFSNGDKFEGIFKNGKRNGDGTLYYKNGGQLKGVWIDDEFVSGSDKKLIVNSDSTFVNLIKTNTGVFEIPIKINNVLDIDFIFDTGASDVLITPDVALTLIRTKKLTEKDLLTGGRYMDANGDINESVRFKIRELKIGAYQLKDITAGISNNVNGACLLGMSALSQFSSVNIDFKNNNVKIIK